MRRIGSNIGFLGINVFLYMHSLPPVDFAAVLDAYRERLMQDRPTVRPLHPNKQGKTRVL